MNLPTMGTSHDTNSETHKLAWSCTELPGRLHILLHQPVPENLNFNSIYQEQQEVFENQISINTTFQNSAPQKKGSCGSFYPCFETTRHVVFGTCYGSRPRDQFMLTE